MANPSYIGDGVYACIQLGVLTLTTGTHDENNADNVIVMERREWEKLEDFVRRNGPLFGVTGL